MSKQWRSIAEIAQEIVKKKEREKEKVRVLSSDEMIEIFREYDENIKYH